MIQRLLRNLCIVCCVLLLPLTAFPYDNETVHKEINEAASRQSKNVTAALEMLSFDNGVDSVVNKKKIVEWFREGGKEEDEPLCRTKFHFHDPTKEPFDKAGLSNIAIDTSCVAYKYRSFLVKKGVA